MDGIDPDHRVIVVSGSLISVHSMHIEARRNHRPHHSY